MFGMPHPVRSQESQIAHDPMQKYVVLLVESSLCTANLYHDMVPFHIAIPFRLCRSIKVRGRWSTTKQVQQQEEDHSASGTNRSFQGCFLKVAEIGFSLLPCGYYLVTTWCGTGSRGCMMDHPPTYDIRHLNVPIDEPSVVIPVRMVS